MSARKRLEMNCERTRDNLVAYLDGEPTAEQRAEIEAHIQLCPQCAAELQRLRAVRADLSLAVPAGLEQVQLSPDAAERIRARLRREGQRRSRARPRPVRPRPRFGSLQAALSAVMVVLIVSAAILVAQPLPVSAQETLVVAPSALTPGTDAALRVIVRQPGSARPIREAQIRVQLAPRDGDPVLLYTGSTGAQGTAEVRFRVPDYGPDRTEADLIVHTASAQGEAEIRAPVVVRRSFRLHLLSDKPLYRPGQAIYLRTLALEAARGLPAANRRILFRVQGVGGETLFERTVPASEFGVASTEYWLPAGAAQGTYRLVAALGDTVSTRTVTVGQYERPAFRVSVELDRTYYLPGQVVQARVIVQSLDDRPMPGAPVTLHAYAHDPDRRLVATAQGRTGPDGTWTADLGLPAAIGAETATLALQASVQGDDGKTTWGGAVVPLAVQALDIDVVAEGGRLRPGIENAITFLCSTPNGAPARAALAVEIEGQAFALETDAYGLTTLRYTPSPDVSTVVVRVAAQAAGEQRATREVILSADRGPAQVLLRLDRAVYRSGEHMRLQALADRGDAVYFDLIHHTAGHTLSTHVARLRQGRATLEIDVSPDMGGTIEVHAYQVLPDGSVAQDTRLAVVVAIDEVQVTVQSDRASYRPGDTARVSVASTIDGAPVQSALGIAVVDESVHALEERAPGFAKLYFMLEDTLLGAVAQPAGVDLPALLDPPADGAVREAQDQAARAAWANLPGKEVRLLRATAQAEDTLPRPLRILNVAMSGALLVLPVLLGWMVIRRARRQGTAGPRLRRAVLLFVGLGLVVVLPVQSAALAGMTLLSAIVGRVLLVACAAAWLIVLIVLGVLALRESDRSLLFAPLLVAAYVVLGVLLGILAEGGAGPGVALSLVLVLGLFVFLAVLLALGAGLWTEGRGGAALLLAALALLLAAIAVLAGAVLAFTSPFASTVSNPQVYAGPVGWLTGCAVTAPSKEAAEMRETVEVEKEVTKVVEKEVEVQPHEPMATATRQPQPTPSPAPTRSPMPRPTATPLAQATRAPEPARPSPTPAPQAAPPLLGQYAPETLYWAPEAITDPSGRLVVDLALPGVETAWRVSVIASTRDGDLGSATARLDVRR